MATNFDKSPEPASSHESDVSKEEKSGSTRLKETAWAIEKVIEDNGALSAEKLKALILPLIEEATQSAIENEKNARVDSLTELPNRRAFEEAMEIEISRFTRLKRQASDNHHQLYSVRLDLDFFKKINDTYGHDTGDNYLKTITRHVRGVLRNSDIFARYGGDEFVMLMPEVDPSHLKEIQERVLLAVREGSAEAKAELMRRKPDLKEEDANITASLGFTRFNGEESAEDFLQRADVYSYIAKSRGRNQAIDDLKVEEIRLEKESKGE